MALKLGNVLISYALFTTLAILFSTFYTGMIDNYNITPTDVGPDGLTVIEKLEGLMLPQGIKEILDGVVDFSNPSSAFDIIGGFLSVGVGVFKTALGLITYPIGVIGIITGFYYIPGIVSNLLILIVVILVSMMLLNKTTGGDD